jgi:hypothetical protein
VTNRRVSDEVNEKAGRFEGSTAVERLERFKLGNANRLICQIYAAVTKSSAYFMVSRSEIDSVKGLRGKKIGINSFGSSADYAPTLS